MHNPFFFPDFSFFVILLEYRDLSVSSGINESTPQIICNGLWNSRTGILSTAAHCPCSEYTNSDFYLEPSYVWVSYQSFQSESFLLVIDEPELCIHEKHKAFSYKHSVGFWHSKDYFETKASRIRINENFKSFRISWNPKSLFHMNKYMMTNYSDVRTETPPSIFSVHARIHKAQHIELLFLWHEDLSQKKCPVWTPKTYSLHKNRNPPVCAISTESFRKGDSGTPVFNCSLLQKKCTFKGSLSSSLIYVGDNEHLNKSKFPYLLLYTERGFGFN